MATTTKKSTPKSNRGGKRAGSGRKPKAVTEMREALIAPMLPEPGEPANVLAMTEGGCLSAPLDRQKSAAEYALDLFESKMRDNLVSLDVRLDCAREVLNRTIGKPRVASEPVGEQADTGGIHVYIPDNGRDSGRAAV